MGRGSKEVREEGKQEFKSTGALRDQQVAEREQARKALLPKFEKFYQGAGFNPEEQAALTQETIGGIGNVYDALRQSAENRMARTGSSAGYYDTLSELGREEARQKQGAQRQNVLTRRQARVSDQLSALQGLSGLYGIDTNLLARISGLPTEAINAQAKGIEPGFFDRLAQLGGAAAGIGAGIGGAGGIAAAFRGRG